MSERAARGHSSCIQREATQFTLHEAGIRSPLMALPDAWPWSLQQSATVLRHRLAAGTWTSYGMSWGCKTCMPAGRLHSSTHNCCKPLQHVWRSQPSSCTCYLGQPCLSRHWHGLRASQLFIDSRFPPGMCGYCALLHVGQTSMLQGSLAVSDLLSPVVDRELCSTYSCLLCRRQTPVYLLNYAVYKPPDSWKSTHKSFLDNSIECGVRPISQSFALPAHLPKASSTSGGAYVCKDSVLSCRSQNTTAILQAFTKDSMEFQRKMIANGGLGQETYLPEGVLQMFCLWLMCSGLSL